MRDVTRSTAKKATNEGRPPRRVVGLTLATPPLAGPEYICWRDGAGWTIRAASLGTVPGFVAVTIRAGMTDKPRELESITAPLLDALTAFGVIESAPKVIRVVAEWCTEIQRGSVDVEVREFASPESRQRYARAAREREAAHRAAAA